MLENLIQWNFHAMGPLKKFVKRLTVSFFVACVCVGELGRVIPCRDLHLWHWSDLYIQEGRGLQWPRLWTSGAESSRQPGGWSPIHPVPHWDADPVTDPVRHTSIAHIHTHTHTHTQTQAPRRTHGCKHADRHTQACTHTHTPTYAWLQNLEETWWMNPSNECRNNYNVVY